MGPRELRIRIVDFGLLTIPNPQSAIRNAKSAIMTDPRHSQSEEVEHLLLNAQLRDEIEPYLDETIERVDLEQLSTPTENAYLQSMLAWERAPVLPICQWFQPALRPPHPKGLDDRQLHETLWELIHKLFQRRIVLDFTDHFSDRELYTLILRDILPVPERLIHLPDHFLHWDCANTDGNAETWLRYYASEQERMAWSCDTKQSPPPRDAPPYPRRLPRRPL